jgi:hypothetical protein
MNPFRTLYMNAARKLGASHSDVLFILQRSGYDTLTYHAFMMRLNRGTIDEQFVRTLAIIVDADADALVRESLARFEKYKNRYASSDNNQ